MYIDQGPHEGHVKKGPKMAREKQGKKRGLKPDNNEN
jgi:hypothetical protein